MGRKPMLLFFILPFLIKSEAQPSKEKKVATVIEQFRKAMVDGDRKILEELTSDRLSYGHSGGHIDNKKEFVEKIVSGQSDFVSIELKDQTISISGKTAIVRHTLNAITNDNGKAGEVYLLVLQVWQKVHGQWKLVARQAVKPVS